MKSLRIIASLCFTLVALGAARSEDSFTAQIAPFLKTYCFECHNEKKPSAELNLTKYKSAAQLADDFRQWEHVITFVRSTEMPPDEAKQPSAADRATFLKTLEELLRSEANKLVGDPGLVLPRRLSNAEYNYTIRDLTGVDIRPADAFPVDPASGEGFSNTGEALQMSPGLFKKYYAAAQQVADHIDFTPSGWKFAPYAASTYADQKKLHEQALLDFYEQHAVNYEKYLTAVWQFRQQPEKQSLADFAQEKKLSPKYLTALHELLSGEPAQSTQYVRHLRERWQAIPGADQTNAAQQQIRDLAAEIKKLSQQLCAVETQAIVGNAGNAPIDHIDRRNKTAATRDTFNASLLSDNRRFKVEYRDLQKKEKIRLVLQIAALTESDKAFVIFKNANVSTANSERDYRPDDSKRNTSLFEILKESNPEQLAKLQLGRHPLGLEIDAKSFAISAGTTLDFEIDTDDLPEGNQLAFFIDAQLDREHSPAGAARVTLSEQATTGKSLAEFSFPLVNPDHKIADELRASCEAFCRVFPNRFYYVDDTRGLSAGYHLIEGFFRDDQPLCKYVLSDDERRELDRLWLELDFGTQIAERMLRGFVFFERSERNFMKHPDFDSFKEEDPDLAKIETVQRLEDAYFVRSGVKNLSAAEIAAHPIHTFFADIRHGLKQRGELLVKAKANYLAQIESFATTAFRRPPTAAEVANLRSFFEKLSSNPEHGIEQAVRASVIRLLVSPHFCYHLDPPAAGNTVEPLSDLALASRLSYFLWSSQPDEELMRVARAGKLHDKDELLRQTRRMLKDPKVSGLALEFFGPWLRYRDFLEQESVSREVFTNFDDALRQAMFEEPTRFTTKLLQTNAPLLELLDSDKTLVNKRLAQHYGLPFNGNKEEWLEVSGLHAQGRSGILGMAVFLTKNSQPQRTSPVKRGFWVIHHLLGEHIPPPPPDVVALPAKETDTGGKTIRQLLALHTEDAKCARCHVRFDGVGLAMEGFDAIGRARKQDLAGRAIDNVVPLPSGKEARGVPEFAAYLAAERADDFGKTLSHKLLGYALGRSLQLSDQPLLDQLQENLRKNGYRSDTLMETIVTSPQFRTQRCRDFSLAAFRDRNAPRPNPASGAKP
ncbi:DUF1592 domain-containing protein [Anatilimnocola floriformis]|uniref:DUF1592 domain-containing protein n=1 Tax=Anatilimnocola floriformis TaxID=2948575 RepID=UPI0020C4EBF3|nr:DUF1592 domain-containing protein [Anatilimnocola floriformis]